MRDIKEEKRIMMKESIINAILLIAILPALVIVLYTLFTKGESEVYNKDGVIMYESSLNRDNLLVVNNNQDIAEIRIGKNKYSIANTNGDKINIAINSEYGNVTVEVNGNCFSYKYEEPDDSDNALLIF